MKTLLRKLGWMLQRRRRRAELHDELAFHLSEEAEEGTAAGLTDKEARYAARRELGSVALVSEDARAVWGWPLVEQFAQDLRHGVRSLFRSPAFTLAAVVTLALGIGLTTAIFSVVYGILLRPLDLYEPDRLMMLHTVDGNGRSEPALSPPNFMSLHEDESRSFSTIAAFMETQLTLTGGGEARRVEATQVSAGFFDVLGVQPMFGRTFNRTENEFGRHRVAVISQTLWQQHFAGNPGVLGRTMMLNEIPHVVVGVMPAGFAFPGERVVWVPLAYRNAFSATTTEGRRNNAYVRVLARLRQGVSIEAARADLGAAAQRLEERFPETNRGVRFTPVPRQEDVVGDVRTLLLLLLGAVGLVLVIASANVASLLLARASSRREEIAVRSALGASRGRIVRQLVTESLVLGLGGNVLGLILAFWVSNSIVAAYEPGLRAVDLLNAIRLDAPVLAFALGITILSTILAGLFPALRAVEGRLGATLQSSGRAGMASLRGERLRGGLVVAQLALAVVLLAGTGLLVKSFLRLTSVDPGFRTERILSFRVDLPSAAYPTQPQIRDFYDRLLGRIARQPGILSAAAISRLPIRMSGSFRSRFRAETGALVGVSDPSIAVRIVTPGYFETMGVPLVEGRLVSGQDRSGNLPVVLINEAAATWMFPGQDPIGRRILNFSYNPIEQAAEAFTIVGVVGDVRSRSLGVGPQPEAYFSHAQVPLGTMSVVFHAAGDPLRLTRAIRNEAAAIDANLPVTEFLPIEEVLTDSLDRQRLLVGMLSLFSGVALALAAVGVFGVINFAVAQRTREIGVRIALGAKPWAVVRAVVGRASALVLAGLVIGIAGALALTRILEAELFDVSPTDPAAFVGVTLVLFMTSLLASLIPAYRATTVDPLTALRAD